MAIEIVDVPMNSVVIFHSYLVGGDWNMTFIFPYIENVIIPIDELIFFRGVGQPPTSI